MFDFADADRKRANPSRWAARLATVPTELFDGLTYDTEKDEKRLTGQMGAVFDCMSDSKWRTLAEIISVIGKGSEAGVSARLRDLRKEKWGGHTVLRRRRGESSKGLFEYRLRVII